MRFLNRLAAVVLVLVAALAATGCNRLLARDQLNKGVLAYRNARFKEAIERFKKAVELDPTLLNARLYLATAYANQFLPGVESEENIRNGQQAIAEYEKVLEVDPKNANSVAGIASIYFNMKKMDDAKKWYKKQIELDPQNPEAYYSVGVIDWTLTYQPRMELKAKLGINQEDPIKDAKARDELCAKNEPLIQEAFAMLNKSIELRPDYDDAMAYLNLMYREQADCEATQEARAEDLKKAEEWIQKNMEIRKKRAEGTSTGAH